MGSSRKMSKKRHHTEHEEEEMEFDLSGNSSDDGIGDDIDVESDGVILSIHLFFN